MNILITAPSLDVQKNVSGISSVVTTIINNNKQHNYIHFIAGREDGEQGLVKRIGNLVKGYRDLYSILEKEQIDIVHLNLPMNARSLYRDYITTVVAGIRRKKILVHLHGGQYLLHKPNSRALKYIIGYIFSKASDIVCLSKLEKEVVEKEYNITNVKVLENTVDDTYLQLKKNDLHTDGLKVLFLGRLHESKGINIILNAVHQLMQQGHTKLQFIFCGAGPLENEVKQLAATYPGNVIYKGTVSGETKMNALNNADVFLLPSLYGEGLPMSLIEAMACGLVPVVTNDGSMKTFVTNGINGIVVDKNDVLQICGALVELLYDKDKLCKISHTAHVFIEQNYSIKQYIISLNDIYENTVC